MWVTESRTSPMQFADGIEMFAGSPVHLSIMAGQLTARMEEVGLRWKPSSLKALSSDGPPPSPAAPLLHIREGHLRLPVVQVAELKTLGCKLESLDCRGSSSHALVPRIEAATFAFWRLKEYFKCRDVSANEKAEKFSK